MKKFLIVLLLGFVPVAGQAQVSFSGGTELTISGFNPNGPAGSLLVNAGLNGSLINTTNGLLTATFLGFEAQHTDTFSLGFGTLSNQDVLGTTISGIVQMEI